MDAAPPEILVEILSYFTSCERYALQPCRAWRAAMLSFCPPPTCRVLGDVCLPAVRNHPSCYGESLGTDEIIRLIRFESVAALQFVLARRKIDVRLVNGMMTSAAISGRVEHYDYLRTLSPTITLEKLVAYAMIERQSAFAARLVADGAQLTTKHSRLIIKTDDRVAWNLIRDTLLVNPTSPYGIVEISDSPTLLADMLDHNAQMNEYLMSRAVHYNRYACVSLLLRRGCPVPATICQQLAAAHRFDWLQFFAARGLSLDGCLGLSLVYWYEEQMNWLLTQSHSWDDEYCRDGIDSPIPATHPEAWRLFVYTIWSTLTPQEQVTRLAYISAAGPYPKHPACCLRAARFANPICLRWLLAHDFPYDREACLAVASPACRAVLLALTE